MNALSPVQVASILTELAKQRTQEAAERTLLSWIQNSLMVIGTSVVINRSFTLLGQGIANRNAAVVQQIANLCALLFIALGIGLLLLAIWKYQLTIHQLTIRGMTHPGTQRPVSHRLITAIITSVVLFGVLAIVTILLTSL